MGQAPAGDGNCETLSVCLITLNEADRLGPCLSSVAPLADQIVVVDAGSVDDTVAIARRYTDEVYQFDWPGFGIQRQRALARASGDWVLSIDADERLDDQAQQALAALLAQPGRPELAFRLRWAVIRHGKRLRFGRSARSPIRLFRREGAAFGDEIVHESLRLPPGPIGQLPGHLLHHTARDYGHASRKVVDYAWLGSQKYFAAGRRQHSLLLVLLRALWAFVQICFLRGGFLDGRIGFVVAMDYALTSYHKYLGLWLLTRQEKQPGQKRADGDTHR